MSLASLKKPARSVERAPRTKAQTVDVDTFIDDAVVYANGGLQSEHSNVVVFCTKQNDIVRSPLKRATFTLGEGAIGQLANLAKEANMPKSKLLRWLIADYSQRKNGRT